MDKKQTFFDYATQYYAAGRFAVSAHLNPVAASLMHHAVEMYLKGSLVDKVTLEDLKSIGHDLVRLHERLKSETGDASLDRFRGIVSMLNDWENVRYPDRMFDDGTICSIGFGLKTPATGKRKHHRLDMYELDELVRALFDLASIDPTELLTRMNVSASVVECLKSVNPALQDVEVPSATAGMPIVTIRADPEMTA